MTDRATEQQVSDVEELEMFVERNYISSYDELATIIRHRAYTNIPRATWNRFKQTQLAYSDHFNHIFEGMQAKRKKNG